MGIIEKITSFFAKQKTPPVEIVKKGLFICAKDPTLEEQLTSDEYGGVMAHLVGSERTVEHSDGRSAKYEAISKDLETIGANAFYIDVNKDRRAGQTTYQPYKVYRKA